MFLLAVDVLVPVVLEVVGGPPGQVVLSNVPPLVAMLTLRLWGGTRRKSGGVGQGCDTCWPAVSPQGGKKE